MLPFKATDQPRRSSEAAPLAVGIEADPLARAGQEADHGRDLHELLEVDHGVVAALADLAEGRGERGEEARERSDVHPERLSHGTAPLEQRDVVRERQEVDLRRREVLAERLQHRKQHDHVPESVELDAEDAPGRGSHAVERRRRGGEQRGQAPAGQRGERPLECEEGEADDEPDPLVDVASVVEIHARGGRVRDLRR